MLLPCLLDRLVGDGFDLTGIHLYILLLYLLPWVWEECFLYFRGTDTSICSVLALQLNV